MSTEVKKAWYKTWWGITSILIVIGLIGSSLGDKQEEQAVVQNSPSSTSTAPVQSKGYTQIATFSGTGQKKSEPFTITGSRFKIAYECTGDPSATYCGAFVFKVGSSLPQGVMNSPKAIKDETVIYGSGEYYIDANVLGDFKMSIYDYK